jgi:hypothetical protein
MKESDDGTAADGNGEGVEATHLFGDVYYQERWPSWYWYLGAALCVLLPPAGVFLLTYMALSNITTGKERTVYAE